MGDFTYRHTPPKKSFRRVFILKILLVLSYKSMSLQNLMVRQRRLRSRSRNTPKPQLYWEV